MQTSHAIRKRLDERRRELLVRYRDTLERIDDELADHATDPIDLASDQWDAVVQSRLSADETRALAAIVAAVRRLDRGVYGVCVDCGEEIQPGRLQAMPEAARCVACARPQSRLNG